MWWPGGWPTFRLQGQCSRIDLSFLLLLLLFSAVHSDPACQLVGKGACRGDGWSEGAWPVTAGKLAGDNCCQRCLDTQGCTAWSLAPAGDCFLYGHQKVTPASALGGECYRVSKPAETPQQDAAKPPTAKPASPAAKPKPAAKPAPPAPAAKLAKEEPKPAAAPASEPAKPKEEPKQTPKPKEEPIVKAEPSPKPAEVPTPAEAPKPPPKPAAAKQPPPKPKEEPPKPAPQAEPAKPPVPKPKEEPLKPAAPKQPKEEPKPAVKKPAATAEDLMVGGKYVVPVGEGGCRGKNWRSGDWPADAGIQSLVGCAQACLDQSCTAFHRLHEQDNGRAECFLFGHAEVLTVRGLGGACYRLSDKKPAKGPEEDDGEEDEVKELKGPVFMAPLGRGRCRGPGWTFKRWPILRGVLSAQACAEACARRRGCTAFDISGDEAKECALYGHAKVAPASGVPGMCYVLSDKPGRVPEGFGTPETEPEEAEEEELEVKGDVDFHQLGRGRCRGAGWTVGKRWPAIRGRLTAKDCALSCAKKRGCTGFDIGVMSEGVEECALYGHKPVVPASGVPGDCYLLGKATTTEEEQDEVIEDIEEEDDGVAHKFSHLGHGMCRGANWQGKRWPVLRGMRTLQECANACGRKRGCTAFDTSKPEGDNLFDCMLYGHKHPVPAPGVPGECYALIGAVFVEPEPEAAPVVPTGSRARILEEDEEDFTNIKDVELLGKGACRGQGWQDGQWPLARGRRSLADCAAECKKTRGCVAFDLSNKEGAKYDCLLLGHQGVLPASALAAKCYIIKGARPDPATLKVEEKVAVSGGKTKKDNYPGSGHGFSRLGTGLCRGDGWQSKGWPVDKGAKTMKECAEACTKERGCRAFDLSVIAAGDKKLFNCLLFNHAKVAPASALDGACYVLSAAGSSAVEPEDDTMPAVVVTEEEEEEDDVIIDLEGDVDVALLGKGGCRGRGWQENGWPQVKGFVSVDRCGQLCVATRGCTAFHVASPRGEGEQVFECFLFGHKSVVPASGLAGNCYTVAKGSSTLVKSAPARPKPAKAPAVKKEKKYKIPEFDPPRVVEDVFDDDDDDWLFEPPPPEIRSREHITQILGLDETSNDAILKVTETTLKDLKKVYETSIKELEKMYKYKELSNRHFGDPEIFNKPLIVFMGPWSGGKSTIINYLLGIEYTASAFRSSAEPSPGFNFNLAMYGEMEEEVDGTQLSAEWAFSSLQKFGQEFLKKLKGKKLPNKLLEKATFAEIPGVLETGTIRKIDRRYPFNDACQWFIDHADLIVLVYDYAKLDIGPETEALLDQLKGREQQVRILLNKADEITAEELLKIQGNLVWNVSPLMASVEPPTLYAGSFWSRPYKAGAPKRLLKSQEQALLKDIREAIDKRVENRIATARRFAVRVRNHAKMVDCYLTTFRNNKGLFGDKKKVAQDIIENPGKYHIYEGLSQLTNISRYDLPDPDTYRDFFNVHPLYDFPTLQSTCTFFKGCPLNKLDIAIAYDLPEILTNYKKKVMQALQPPTAAPLNKKTKTKSK